MGKGTATASTPTHCISGAEVKAAIDNLTLASLNAGASAGDNYDKIVVVPSNLGGFLVFKIAFAVA